MQNEKHNSKRTAAWPEPHARAHRVLTVQSVWQTWAVVCGCLDSSEPSLAPHNICGHRDWVYIPITRVVKHFISLGGLAEVNKKKAVSKMLADSNRAKFTSTIR